MFRTCDHYYDEYPINKSESNTCFICLEDTDNLIQLKNHNLFIKLCNCKGIVHHSCLVTWLKTTQRCPICRRDYLIKKYLHIIDNVKFVLMYLLFCIPSLCMIFMSGFLIFKLICFMFYVSFTTYWFVSLRIIFLAMRYN